MTAPAGPAEPATPGTVTDPATPPAGPPAPAPATTEPPTPPVPGTETDPQAELDKWKGLARKHEARAKQNEEARAAESERVQAILKAAGIETAEADPIKALEESKQSNANLASENRGLKVQLALVDAAKTHKADRSLLAAVLVHSGTLAQLDPASDTFTADLDKAVADAVKANPKLQDTSQFPDMRQGNQGTPAGTPQDPNAWLRQMAGR